MMKRPVTTAELFDRIRNILKEKGMVPDILDYGTAACFPVLIRTSEFELAGSLAYGASEGIYLYFWIVYYTDGERQERALGTFKTLYGDRTALHIMAGLQADFMAEWDAYVKENRDDFVWEGADIYLLDAGGRKTGQGYYCSSMEAALKKKDSLLERYLCVAVRDNSTRKEQVFRREKGTETREAG